MTKSRILGHVKASRKDKQPIRFIDYTGEKAENKYAPMFVIFENKFGGGDLRVEKNVVEKQVVEYLFSGDYFISFFPRKDAERDDDF